MNVRRFDIEESKLCYAKRDAWASLNANVSSKITTTRWFVLRTGDIKNIIKDTFRGILK